MSSMNITETLNIEEFGCYAKDCRDCDCDNPDSYFDCDPEDGDCDDDWPGFDDDRDVNGDW